MEKKFFDNYEEEGESLIMNEIKIRGGYIAASLGALMFLFSDIAPEKYNSARTSELVNSVSQNFPRWIVSEEYNDYVKEFKRINKNTEVISNVYLYGGLGLTLVGLLYSGSLSRKEDISDRTE